MSNIIKIPDRDKPGGSDIEAEARSWLVQLDGARPSRRELREFRQWLNRSPSHRQAFQEAAQAWNDLDGLSRILDRLPATAAEEKSTLTDWLSNLLQSGTAAAVLALLIVLGITVLARQHPAGHNNDGWLTTGYVTAIGETRTVSLPDGSRISLNTDTRLNVAYTPSARIIHLARGEAWFEVAHNRDRPFIVYAARYAVEAVGTAFSVRIAEKNVDLTVTSGRIEIATLDKTVPPEAIPDARAIRKTAFRVPLAEGQHMILDNRLGVKKDDIELVQDVRPEQIEKSLSWRNGLLIFDNDRLEDVVAEINRYTPMKIIISEADLRDMRFGGYFRADDVNSILATLEEGFDIRVEKVRPDIVFLSRRHR